MLVFYKLMVYPDNTGF